LSKSENLRLRVKIECSGVFVDNTLFVSGNLTKINLEHSKMVEVYNELKEKQFDSKEKRVNLLSKDKLYISQFPKKSSTITNNIVNVLVGNQTSNQTSNQN